MDHASVKSKDGFQVRLAPAVQTITKNLILFYLLFLPRQWHLPDDLSSSRFFSHVNKPAVTVLYSYPFPTQSWRLEHDRVPSPRPRRNRREIQKDRQI